jgi:membrane protein YdbS with pleckstrin-like domain
MFGLATLQLYTASGNSGDMHLKGLPLATAHALQQTINQAINNLSVNEK